MALKRVVVNLDEKLLEKVEMYASMMSVNRTAAISFLLVQGLNYANLQDNVDKLVDLAKLVKEQG